MRIAVVTRPKPDASGLLPLYVRVSHGGKTRYVALGLRVRAGDWNGRRREVRRSHPEHRRLNRLLAGRLREAEAAAEGALSALGRHAAPDALKAAVQAALHPEPEPEPVRAVGLVELARRIGGEHRSAGRVATAVTYERDARALEAALRASGAPGGDVAVGAVTAEAVRAYERHLRARGLRPNTVQRMVGRVRTVLRRAALDGEPGAGAALAGAESVRVRGERVAKARLSRGHVAALEAARAGLSGRRRDVLDWFLFAFFAGGMRFGDVLALRWSSVERGPGGEPVRLRWRMRKTGDAQAVPVLPEAAAILREWEAVTLAPEAGSEAGSEASGASRAADGRFRLGGRVRGFHSPSPFVFGLISEAEAGDPARLFGATHRWSAVARKHLREVSEATSTPYVGFHGARHSLADHLRQSGVGIETIRMVLGHTTTTQTQAYLAAFDDGAVGRALRDHV